MAGVSRSPNERSATQASDFIACFSCRPNVLKLKRQASRLCSIMQTTSSGEDARGTGREAALQAVKS